jgi:hypothetical protein
MKINRGSLVFCISMILGQLVSDFFVNYYGLNAKSEGFTDWVVSVLFMVVCMLAVSLSLLLYLKKIGFLKD